MATQSIPPNELADEIVDLWDDMRERLEQVEPHPADADVVAALLVLARLMLRG